MVGFVFAGLATLRGGILILVLPILIYLGAGLLRAPAELRLRVTRTLTAERVSPGEPVGVSLIIMNDGPDLDEVTLRDLTPEGLEIVEGDACVVAPLPSGETLELTYTVRGSRGTYRFPGVRAVVREPFGVWQVSGDVEAPAFLFVLPEVARLRQVEIRPRRTRVYSGIVPARLGGPGVEFYGVREYHPGDPLRWLNSRATARDPERLYITEYEQERVADVGLVLDARRGCYGSPSDAGVLFECAVQAAATLADAFLGGGHRVGMLVYGGHIDWTIPGYGKVQRERILRALAGAELGTSPIFLELEHLPTRLFPAGSQIVFVSPLRAGDEAMLSALRARGYAVWAVSPDPISLEAKRLRPSRDVELAARIARSERAILLRALRQAGVIVLDWDVETPFHHVAQVALRRSPLFLRLFPGGPRR
jgi:uncharacterized protein (DUF58 family)